MGDHSGFSPSSPFNIMSISSAAAPSFRYAHTAVGMPGEHFMIRNDTLAVLWGTSLASALFLYLAYRYSGTIFVPPPKDIGVAELILFYGLYIATLLIPVVTVAASLIRILTRKQ
jgi:hypothetical protein